MSDSYPSRTVTPKQADPPFTAVNWITNPAFTTSLTGWTASAGVADFSNVDFDAQVTLQGAGTPGEITTDFIDVAPGEDICISAYAATDSSAGTNTVFLIRVDGYDDGDVLIATQDSGPAVSPPFRHRLSWTVPSIPTAVFKVKVSLVATNPTEDDVVVSWDAVSLTNGWDMLPYFDGETADDAVYTYFWNGTPHESTSTRTPP